MIRNIKDFDIVFRDLELEPPVDEECIPYDYFNKCVTNEMLQYINIYSMQTNAYKCKSDQ